MRCLLIILWLLSSWAGAAPFELDQSTLKGDIDSHIVFFEDASAELSLSDIKQLDEKQWRANDQGSFNKSYSDSSWWLKFSVINTSPENLLRLVEISYPVLDYVNLYAVSASETQSFYMGDKLPFSERPLPHRNFVAPLEFKAGQTYDLYVNVRSTSSIQIPIALWQRKEFFSHHQSHTMVHGLYFGIVFVMMIYNLIVFLVVGERSFLYYVLFVVNAPIFMASLNGFTYQHLWPSKIHWNDHVIILSQCSMVFFGSLFTWEFLKIKQLKPVFNYLTQGFALGSLLLMGLSFLLPYSISIHLTITLAISACFSALGIGYLRWYQGDYSAKYYAIAWSVFLCGGIAMALSKYNIFPRNNVTHYAIQLGSAIEVILLSFALAERIRQERLMRFEAQRVSLDSERKIREAREDSLKMQKKAAETLELRVEERTKQLAEINKKLEEISDTDQLTGLKNRRYLDRILEEEFIRCTRYHRTIAVLLMDIDHFKQFNDLYGHMVGDDCLKEVANQIQTSLRWPSDQSARYGGEEFCVILPETNFKGALAVAERIRASVETMEFFVNDELVPVTISIGVSAFTPTNSDQPDTLVEQADKALYASKDKGRNQVTLYNALSLSNKNTSNQNQLGK